MDSMTLTRSFEGLVQRQIASDPTFATALLCEGVASMLAGDIETGKTLLADYIAATHGFEALGKGTSNRPAALVRMFGPHGKPRARALLGVLAYLQKRAGLQLHVTARPG
jgi:hypothetical protein